MFIKTDLRQFRNEFHKAGRDSQFSDEALRALFNYLRQLEEDLGEEFELDVIWLCCDYAELTEEEFKEEYPDENIEDCEHVIARLEGNRVLIRQF